MNIQTAAEYCFLNNLSDHRMKLHQYKAAGKKMGDFGYVGSKGLRCVRLRKIGLRA